MGFTTYLTFAYCVLIGLAVLAFRRNNSKLGYGLIALMAIGDLVLTYLWMKSSM